MLALLVGLTAATLVGAGYVYEQVARTLPESAEFPAMERSSTNEVRLPEVSATDGSATDGPQGTLVAEFSSAESSEALGGARSGRRYPVESEDVSPQMRRALIAIEDRAYYQHAGLDFGGITRAALANLSAGGVVQGGSTITQQYVENVYLGGPTGVRGYGAFGERRPVVEQFARKFVEATLAYRYEARLSKREILEQYLNTVYFGERAYGVEAAARTYFDTSAADLNLSQSAMLAGMLAGPEYFDPFERPRATQARRGEVLDALAASGEITPERASAMKEEPLGVVDAYSPADEELYAGLATLARQELHERYPEEELARGGLTVELTVAPELQQAARQVAEASVSPEDGTPSAAIASVDPESGEIRAAYSADTSGEDEPYGFDYSWQAARQIGSTMKPFVLAAGLEGGEFGLDTTVDSRPLTVPADRTGTGAPYTVQNYEGRYAGEITAREALVSSDNSAYVQLALMAGMEDVATVARAAGIGERASDPLSPYPSLAIGGMQRGSSALELASAYSTFASGSPGVRVEPTVIESVSRGGESIEPVRQPRTTRVVSGDTASEVHEALSAVVDDGARQYYGGLEQRIGAQAAAKTGTTENFADAWFAGLGGGGANGGAESDAAGGAKGGAEDRYPAGELSTASWVGYEDRSRSMADVPGYGEINGAELPLENWREYMARANGR